MGSHLPRCEAGHGQRVGLEAVASALQAQLGPEEVVAG